MSGVEALAVISIIANIVALTDFSCKVVLQIKEYGENAPEVPKAFRDIQAVLPLISRTTTQTQDQIKAGIFDEDICKVLKPVLEACENKLKQLEATFKDVMAQEGASKIKRGLMAIKSIRKEKEVKEIAKALDMFVRRLVEVLTTKDIESLRSAMSSMSAEQPAIQSSKTHFLVPVQWSNDFAGREEVMAFLESRLCLEDQHSRVALVGLGGMGKTRIALQYAKKFKKSNALSVFWVYAGTAERFKNAYRHIARKLKIPGCQSPDSDVLNLVKDWLEDDGSGQWLMIFDNADDAEIMYGSGPPLRLADYLPRSNQGSILLTTRFQRVGANFTFPQNIFKLQSMTLKESELLLRARLGDNPREQNRETYQELAKELENTPLALVQAASYMSQNCMTLATYLQLYRQSDVAKIRLLSEDFEDDVRDFQAKNPIATTWIISFDYVKMRVPQAAELLSLMSVMDAQAIPEFLMPQGEDAFSFNRAVGTLEAFSFISTRTPSLGSLQRYRLFDLHRLVRLAIRNWLKMNNILGQTTAQALTILGLDCLQEDSLQFEMSSLILPHAIEILSSNQLPSETLLSQFSENADLPSLSDLRSLATIPSGQMGKPTHSLKDAESMSNNLIHTAELLDYAVFHFVAARNHKTARIFAAKSLIVTTGACGQSHIRTLFSMYTLASILQDLGDYELAEHLRRQYVTVCMAEYGSHHVLTLQGLLYLRNLLEEEKEQEAKEIGRYALQQCKESLLLHEGKEFLKILSLLAEFNQYNSDFEEVEDWQRLALRGYKAINDVINVIATLRSLSRTYERQEKWGLAGDTKKIELETCISCHGQNHPMTMHARLGLTYVLLKDKKKEEARQLASSALELTSQVFGPSSDNYTNYCSEFDRLFEISSRQEQLISSLENASTAQMASSMPETNETVMNVMESPISQQMQIT